MTFNLADSVDDLRKGRGSIFASSRHASVQSFVSSAPFRAKRCRADLDARPVDRGALGHDHCFDQRGKQLQLEPSLRSAVKAKGDRRRRAIVCRAGYSPPSAGGRCPRSSVDRPLDGHQAGFAANRMRSHMHLLSHRARNAVDRHKARRGARRAARRVRCHPRMAAT